MSDIKDSFSSPEFRVSVRVTITAPHGQDARVVHREVRLDPAELRSMKVRYSVAAELKMSSAFEAVERETAWVIAETMAGQSGQPDKLPT
jgi:hypothetical protein